MVEGKDKAECDRALIGDARSPRRDALQPYTSPITHVMLSDRPQRCKQKAAVLGMFVGGILRASLLIKSY